MSKNELKLQRQICISVRSEGGYALKLNNRFSVGVPDLLIALPPYPVIVAEVKDMGEVSDSFDRQIGVTPKQALELERISKPYEIAKKGARAVILVGLKHRGEYRLVINPRYVNTLNYRYEDHPGIWVARQAGVHYNIGHLLREGLDA